MHDWSTAVCPRQDGVRLGYKVATTHLKLGQGTQFPVMKLAKVKHV